LLERVEAMIRVVFDVIRSTDQIADDFHAGREVVSHRGVEEGAEVTLHDHVQSRAHHGVGGKEGDEVDALPAASQSGEEGRSGGHVAVMINHDLVVGVKSQALRVKVGVDFTVAEIPETRDSVILRDKGGEVALGVGAEI
jgi:hypothetical protein